MTTNSKYVIGFTLGFFILLSSWISNLPALTQSFCAAPIDGNLIQNPYFEDGKAVWQFFSNGAAGFETTTLDPMECSQSAQVTIQNPGSNVQLYQTGMLLQPDTTYRLRLAARSTTGQDVKVFVHRHSAPYTEYGLSAVSFDLGTDWQIFEAEFTTMNFNSTTTDSRLRIWLAESNIAGESYYFDQVSIVPVSSAVATETPTEPATQTPPPLPTNTNTPTATATSTTAPTATATATATSTTAPTATATTAPTNTPTATEPSSQGQCAGPVSGNLVQNFGFEEGATAWTFFTNAQAVFSSTTTNPFDCARAAEVAIQSRGSNVQLYQTGLTLQPATTYRLSLAARSTTGRDVKVFLQRHSAPYTNYGLSGVIFDLGTGWQTFETEFTTANFNSMTTDSRLRIWLAESNVAGESYYFDRVSLVPVSSAAASATPTQTPPAANTATASPTATSTTAPTATATATSTTAPTATSTTAPTATEDPSQNRCAGPVSGNVVQNPGFEDGVGAWTFHSSGTAQFTSTTTNPFDCARSAQVAIQTRGSNVQLYQTGVTLQPATTYRLSLAARSSTGRDVKLHLQRHTSPYTNYGLSGVNLNLTSNWQTFTVEFTTSGFTSPVSNGRLRLALDESNIAGEVYYFDVVSLVPLSSPPQPTATKTPVGPTPTPTKTPVGPTSTPAPTSTPGSPPSSNTELLVFNWTQMVTIDHRGFANVQPPEQNGNWMTPINYAEGTFHYRAQVLGMPTHQDMKLQFCIWQYKNGSNFGLENCGSQQLLRYKGSKVVATWSQDVQKLWMKGGQIIEWNRARYRNGVAIKTPEGLPVSNFSGWNWNGENPNHWFPMNLRFTVVVVAKGHTFSGWQNYP